MTPLTTVSASADSYAAHDIINIDLIIRSKSKQASKDGGKKRIPVYSTGDRGKYLYQLNLKLSQSGLGLTDISSQQNIINLAQKRLDRMKKGNDEINLKEFYKDDQHTLNRILGYEEQLELANNLDLPAIIHCREADENLYKYDKFCDFRPQAQNVTLANAFY